jgi:thiosulfate/3-mercaptopyruvate sulfurtransferase
MGIRSGFMSMILRAVGFEKVRNYEASIYEWSADANMPMETGEYQPK